MEELLDMFIEDSEDLDDATSIGEVGLLLAMTNSLYAEKKLETIFQKKGFKSVVTEVSGSLKKNFQEKFTKAVLGASFGEGIIIKKPKEVHALLHAAEECTKGINSVAAAANIRLKVAIVRKGDWIVVATFGQTFILDYTGHHRSSLGVMHI